jgi:ParB family chromosome partitioning protein
VVERGIGRGLAAILPLEVSPNESLHQIPVELIRPNPRQPRTALDELGLGQLADSIKVHGLLQPLLVRALSGGTYELIAGERRWRAARLAGLERVPALVRSSQDSERLELALIENMAREDLNSVDAARACAALVDELGLTKEEVGKRVGRGRVAISNLIRLLELPDEVLAMLEANELTEGHGRALLQAPGPQAQRALARTVREKRLSVREAERLARSAHERGGSVARGQASPRADIEAARREAEDELAGALGLDVRLRVGRKACTVELTLEDLQAVRELARRLARRLAA